MGSLGQLPCVTSRHSNHTSQSACQNKRTRAFKAHFTLFPYLSSRVCLRRVSSQESLERLCSTGWFPMRKVGELVANCRSAGLLQARRFPSQRNDPLPTSASLQSLPFPLESSVLEPLSICPHGLNDLMWSHGLTIDTLVTIECACGLLSLGAYSSLSASISNFR